MSPRAEMSEAEARRVLKLGGGRTGEEIDRCARAAAAEVFLEHFDSLRTEMRTRFDQTDSITRAAVMRAEDAAQGVQNIAFLVQGGKDGKGQLGDLQKEVAAMRKLQSARHKTYMKKFEKGLSNQAELKSVLIGLHHWLSEKGDSEHTRYYRLGRGVVALTGAALSAVFGGYSVPYWFPHLTNLLHRGK